jgi:hypothetical protein
MASLSLPCKEGVMKKLTLIVLLFVAAMSCALGAAPRTGIHLNLPVYVKAGVITETEANAIKDRIDRGLLRDTFLPVGTHGTNYWVTMAGELRSKDYYMEALETNEDNIGGRYARTDGCHIWLQPCDNLFVPVAKLPAPLPKTPLPGPAGPQGQTGQPGPSGPQGEPGQPGHDGLNGKDGQPGPAGPQGKQGEQGPPGQAFVYNPPQRSLPPIGTSESYAPDFRVNYGSTEFRQGLQIFGGIAIVPTPVDGRDGRDGLNGNNGLNGQNGLNGLNGNNGLPGPAGPAGPCGPAGPQYCPPLPIGTHPPQPNL